MTKTSYTWKYAEHTRAKDAGNHVVMKMNIRKTRKASESHEEEALGNGEGCEAVLELIEKVSIVVG